MKHSVKAREKNYLKAKNGPIFFSLNCVQTSLGLPFCNGLSLDCIRRLRNLTIHEFRQLHLESVKNAMLSQVQSLADFLTGTLSFIRLNIIMKIVLSGICNIIMIQSE